MRKSFIVQEETHVLVLLLLALIYIYKWRDTATLTVVLIAIMIPFSVFGYIVMECIDGLFYGLMAILCFLFDRYLKIPTHSGWHIFGYN